MSLSDRSSNTTVSTTPLHAADTRLHGRWLALAWAAWALLSSGTLLAFAFGLPVYLTLLQTVCTGTGCLPGQPTPDTEAALHGLGLSPGSYAICILVLTLVSLLVACTMSGLLAWRKPRDWLALLVALMFILLPLIICFAIAILRSRLWEIDVIINRTLVYSTLTGTLALVYVGLVIGLQALLRGITSQDSSVAIVISTLAIAALFQPLRHRIQQVIDRRFYRSKYDAKRIIDTFSTRLREETDLTQLSEQLVAVVQETMQPAHVSLWLRKTERERTPNLDGSFSASTAPAERK